MNANIICCGRRAPPAQNTPTRLRQAQDMLAQDLAGPAQLLDPRLSSFNRALPSATSAAGAVRRLASSRHQRREDSAVQPIFHPIEVIASHSEP
jgi:hypothetical protein